MTSRLIVVRIKYPVSKKRIFRVVKSKKKLGKKLNV